MRKFILFLALILVGFFIGAGYQNIQGIASKVLSFRKTQEAKKAADQNQTSFDKAKDAVLPKEGFTLPIAWGTLGPKLVSLGVIDQNKFEQAVKPNEEQKGIIEKGSEEPIKIDSANSQFVVDMLWAIGLAQKSIVYTEGPLGTKYKSQVGNFASTGGWNLAKGQAVSYLGKFSLIPLTPDQQKRVGEIAKGVFRPCCGNSAWFPDCNHGMAALAAIEMMVSKDMPDDEIYKNVLKLNSFWFPDTYVITAMYFEKKGISWDKVDAKEALGQKFSSGQGAANIAKEVGPLPGAASGGSCSS